MNAGLSYLLVQFNTRVGKKRSKLFTRVFLLHHPVFEGQSTGVSRSQGALECLVHTIKGRLRIEVVEEKESIKRWGKTNSL